MLALDHLDLNVKRGSFFAILGPNGAGKSTLINILADTVKQTSGSVKLFGENLFSRRKWCKQQMGVVPQELSIDPYFTVNEIMKVTAGLYGVRLEKAWANELLEHLDLLPHAKKNTRALSGGMRRRLLVAQALVHRPSLVILDEPTAGVDVELRRRLWDFLRRLNASGTTILLTTHYLDEAQELCDEVAIIDQGKVLCAKPMVELMQGVADSHMMLHYAQPVSWDAKAEKNLQKFNPVLLDNARSLKLSISHQKDNGHSNFDEAYVQVKALFGAPMDVQINQENLEDVFIKVTQGVQHD